MVTPADLDATIDPALRRGGALTARPDDQTLSELAAEHFSLRRIAELVAKGAPQGDVFAAVAVEASRLTEQNTSLLRVERDGGYTVIADCGGLADVGMQFTVAEPDAGLLAEIARTRRPARRDDYAELGGPTVARDGFGVRSATGVPVIVDDRIWGVLVITTIDGRRVPPVAEPRLTRFAELMAAALANAQARSDLQRMVDEQIALCQLAELVARTAPTEEIFDAVARNASRRLDDAPMTLTRYAGDGELIVVASHCGPAPIGTHIAYAPDTLPDRLRRTGQPVRIDEYRREPDADMAIQFSLAAAVSVPISVDSEIWGMLTATSDSAPVPAGTEEWLLKYAGLVTAALSNVQARTELQALAAEQAALRSVAELAAQDVPAKEVLAAVARQACRLEAIDFCTLLRFEPDGSTEIAALDGGPDGITVGMRAPPTGDSSTQRVWQTGKPARCDNLATASSHWAKIAYSHGFTTSAAVPIPLQGKLWGVISVVGRGNPLPEQIHTQLSKFAELATTAIAAAQDRQKLAQMANEQAACRRVAELVARGVDPDAVFTAVAAEASHLHGGLGSVLARYEPDAAIVLATCNSRIPLGHRSPTLPGTALGEILRTGAPVRLDSTENIALAEAARQQGIAAGIAVPIMVEGRIWGALATTSDGPPLLTGREDRLTTFAELTAASIANADYRHRLTASRARVVASADETRRRLQRDVHDSAQQRLVHAVITLKLAKAAIVAGDPNGDVAALVDEALQNAQRANKDLRDVVHGILPTALTYGGLRAGLRYLVADFPLPVQLDANIRRIATETETAAYFVVAEALTNVVKHAHATAATVRLTIDDTDLGIEVVDDGVGGANTSRGSGLIGLIDRVEANNGTLVISSPAGSGTAIRAKIPIHTQAERSQADDHRSADTRTVDPPIGEISALRRVSRAVEACR